MGKELTLDRIQVRELVLVLLTISCVVVLVNVRGYANSSEPRGGAQQQRVRESVKHWSKQPKRCIEIFLLQSFLVR